MIGLPQEYAIGDWLVVAMTADGKAAGFGEENARLEACELTGIVESEYRYHYNLHVAVATADGDVIRVVPEACVRNIRICDETVSDFGFEPCQSDGYLYDEHCWRLDCSELRCPDLSYFRLSWREDEDGGQQYRIVCRGYGEKMSLEQDSIAAMQHFFYRFSHGWPMPLKYRGRSHFHPIPHEEPSVVPALKRLGISPAIIQAIEQMEKK